MVLFSGQSVVLPNCCRFRALLILLNCRVIGTVITCGTLPCLRIPGWLPHPSCARPSLPPENSLYGLDLRFDKWLNSLMMILKLAPKQLFLLINFPLIPLLVDFPLDHLKVKFFLFNQALTDTFLWQVPQWKKLFKVCGPSLGVGSWVLLCDLGTAVLASWGD